MVLSRVIADLWHFETVGSHTSGQLDQRVCAPFLIWSVTNAIFHLSFFPLNDSGFQKVSY